MQGQKRAVIVGGGIMGADIAAICAAAGHAVDVVQRVGNHEGGQRKQLV